MMVFPILLWLLFSSGFQPYLVSALSYIDLQSMSDPRAFSSANISLSNGDLCRKICSDSLPSICFAGEDSSVSLYHNERLDSSSFPPNYMVGLEPLSGCSDSEESGDSLSGFMESREMVESSPGSLDSKEGLESLKCDGEISSEVIVRFTSYKYATEHQNALSKSMQQLDGWEWVERVNPASAFPTDFGLLRIKERGIDSVVNQLKALNFVKDVSQQSRFTRALLKEDEITRDSSAPSFGMENNDSSEESAKYQSEGKRSTPWSEDGDLMGQCEKPSLLSSGRKILLQRSQITSMFGADQLWSKGFTGAKVRMAVFDTGVRADHPHFRNIKERTNWTNEDTLNDNLGHGTFVAGVISSKDPQCLGFAPDAEIYAFRVFTDAQVSYTSWFLDAFNYAIATEINILNLSIGGPDFLDRPFIEKVWEMTANNVIMVSAIGNDGPLYGTLNNPADQSDVIGVGGIDYSDHIASFSSRGMTTWEIPHGYGRVKPDIVAYGRDIIGSRINSGCKSLSGTSVASPVVAGAVCLLASVIPESIRWNIINPASMKQAIIEGASRLEGPNIFEQGSGRLNLLESYEILVKYKPRASLVPPVIDFLDCPYMWPFCRQPLYAGAMPVVFNVTILNGMGVVGYVEKNPTWNPSDIAGNLLDIRFTFSDTIWPWTGFLGLHMEIRDEGVNFAGIIEGDISLSIVSPSRTQGKEMQRSECTLHLRVNVIPTPRREQRILWDQFHNVRYPPGYIPRDSLDVRNDILDWHGDHPHTNFHSMFDILCDAGYYVEILGSPFTCFDARQYGTLLMVDLEDEYFEEEKFKLENDVKVLGLGLIVFADWYHLETMIKMKFFDDNTRSWWTPVTGGANIPALNDLLLGFGIGFGGTILTGPYSIDGQRGFFASGTDISVFPDGGFLHRFTFQDGTKTNSLSSSLQTSAQPQVEAAVLGAVERGLGRVAVYGDSNCLDNSHLVTDCYWLLKKLLDFTSHNLKDPVLFAPSKRIHFPLNGLTSSSPSRRKDVKFSMYSLVLDHELQCGVDARFEVQGTKGYERHIKLPFSSGQRQPKGSDRPNREDMSMVLSNNTVGDGGVVSTTLIDGLLKNQESHVGAVSQKHDLYQNYIRREGMVSHQQKSDGKAQEERRDNNVIGLTSRWLHHDEFDSSALLAVQWLIPILLCFAGFLLIISLWRSMQQKRRKRVRKGSARSLLVF